MNKTDMTAMRALEIKMIEKSANKFSPGVVISLN